MHGLAGIISPGAPPALAASHRRMLERLCHDRTAVFRCETLFQPGLHVGSLGPAPLPLADVSGWSPCRRIAVLLAGEEFSADAAAGSATALATAFARRGRHALRDLNGWFSGIVVDLRHDTATLFNDRYGLGRVYYHAAADGFYFSSEAKSLLAILPSLRRLDPRGLAEYFAVGCVLQNRSLFPDLSLLPPGSAWTFHRDGRVERERYFDPVEWERQPPLPPDEYSAQLREVFARLAQRYLRGDAPVAMSLTGGLDSRAVIAWTRAAPGTLPCYTFGGPYRDCADVLIARRLAAVCRHPHTTIRVGPEFFPRFADLAADSVYLSDGTMDVSGAVELHVNRQAREIAPVRLTGNYGSEILRSHVAFRPGRLDRTLFTPGFNGLLDEAEATYRTEAACHRLTFIAFKQVPWHHYARFAVEKTQLTPRSPFLDNDLVALAYRAPAALAASPAPLLELIAHGNPRLAAIGTDRALQLRARPLVSPLSRAWREFTARAEYACDYGMPRWLARADRALSRLHFERLFLGRHKFYHFRIWYRDQLREAVRAQALAAGAPTPFCYREGAPRRLAHEHLSGAANRTLELHKLLSLQLVDRLLLRPS